MKTLLGLLLIIESAFFACTSGITTGKYIEAMSTLGCRRILNEQSGVAREMYQELGIQYDDIVQFRRQSSVREMGEISTTIAENVEACHGINQ